MGERVEVAAAFDLFYRRHREAVLAYLAPRTPDIHVAFDLTQEVFARAYLRRGSFDGSHGSARPWLFATARNLLIDHAHGRKRDDAARRRLGIERDHYTDAALEEVEANIDADALLAGLSPAERASIQARILDDLTYADIAAASNIQPSTARKYVSDGLARLKRKLAR